MIIKSIKKSFKLKKLQGQINKYSPDKIGFDTDQMIASVKHDLETPLNKYLDFCMQDDAIKILSKDHLIDKNRLRKIYDMLKRNGAYQHIKGHDVELSSLIYLDPLRYILIAEEKGESPKTICFNIVKYWQSNTKLPY